MDKRASGENHIMDKAIPRCTVWKSVPVATFLRTYVKIWGTGFVQKIRFLKETSRFAIEVALFRLSVF